MTPRKPSRRVLRSLCGDVHPDDGVDPRESVRRDRARKSSDHRARRLCRQVAETIDSVLSGQAGDDLLRGLQVASVEPAPDVSRLLVTVRVPLPDGAIDPVLLLDRLASASGRLRAEVAASITRRKVPTLTFRIALPGGSG